MTVTSRSYRSVSDVELAQSEVDSARGRLMATFEQIQQRIAPSTLVEEAIEQVKTRSTEIAHSASDVVRERPATFAATAAGIGFFLAAKPLTMLFGRRKAKADETTAPPRRSHPNETASEGQVQ